MLESLLRNNPQIFLDTMVFIYHFEAKEDFLPLTKKIFRHIETGLNQGLTSTITVAELLIQPYALKNYRVRANYHLVLQKFPNLSLLNIDFQVADIAASLSAKYNLLLPDALQIACAINGGANIFFTNDIQLRKIKEIQVVLLKELKKGA